MHTKGPWKVHPYNKLAICVDPQKEGYAGRQIAMVNHFVDRAGAEAHANAQLIAAAPELLDVVAAFLVDQERLREPCRNEAICEKAEVVIAKALKEHPT